MIDIILFFHGYSLLLLLSYNHESVRLQLSRQDKLKGFTEIEVPTSRSSRNIGLTSHDNERTYDFAKMDEARFAQL